MTIKELEVIIIRKYIKKIGNNLYYVVYDDSNNKYYIASIFWFSQYNQKDIWDLIIQGKKYKITYFGLKIIFLGIYPMIIKIK